ncbi:hypothetical protein [Kribbella sp. NPDC051620]|uniref:hypothetical protein n=1 Tax=Kribbella sp. NPDC051620 TaxID=3364120 RepID=UPI0037BD0B4E
MGILAHAAAGKTSLTLLFVNKIDCRRELADQVRRTRVHPAYFGSAMTGEGVPELIAGIRRWLPRATGRPDAPLRAQVFKVERDSAGSGTAIREMAEPGNLWCAAVGFRISPAPPWRARRCPGPGHPQGPDPGRPDPCLRGATARPHSW